MPSGRVIPFEDPGAVRSRSARRSGSVVQIGRDAVLLLLREKIFRAAGYLVRSLSPEEARAEIQQAGDFRVWLFCHTLEFYEIAMLGVAIRQQRPHDKLLRLIGLNDTAQAPGIFDELIGPVVSVDEMLGVVAELSRQSTSDADIGTVS